MDLKQIKGVGPAKQDKLRTAGIATIDQLARADVAAVAAKTGIPIAQVKELKHRAAALSLIEDLKGIGPGTLDTLSDAANKSVRELYAASADWVEAQLKVARARIIEAKAEAERLARHVASESQTHDGRVRLAAEGRAFAEKTAVDAQATGRRVFAAAKKESEMVSLKVRELREKAPELVHDAEHALRQAEVRLKAATHKAETVLKAEAQKVKANTERVVEQTRSRFNKAE